MSSRRANLTFGQHVTIAVSRALLGTLTGAIRLARGLQPEGWRTLRYGILREETLDHFPVHDGDVHAPVVFIHGGGWMMGNTATYSHDLLFLAEAGYPIFNVEYPKAPEHQHPMLLRSILKALAFIRAGFSQKSVHLMGDSAGGNLAVMVALLTANPELLTAVDPTISADQLPEALSVTSLYGVLDRQTCLNGSLPAGDTMIESYAGKGALSASVDAAHAITPMDLTFQKHPPCLLACGDADPLLASQNVYAARLRSEGFAVTDHVYPNGIHAFLNFPESAPKTACRTDILAFLRSIPG
jgi:acetyl esterase